MGAYTGAQIYSANTMIQKNINLYRHDVHAAFELQTIYRLQNHFQKYLKRRVSYYYHMQYENCQLCGSYFISPNYGTYCLYENKNNETKYINI